MSTSTVEIKKEDIIEVLKPGLVFACRANGKYSLERQNRIIDLFRNWYGVDHPLIVEVIEDKNLEFFVLFFGTGNLPKTYMRYFRKKLRKDLQKSLTP